MDVTAATKKEMESFIASCNDEQIQILIENTRKDDKEGQSSSWGLFFAKHRITSSQLEVLIHHFLKHTSASMRRNILRVIYNHSETATSPHFEELVSAVLNILLENINNTPAGVYYYAEHFFIHHLNTLSSDYGKDAISDILNEIQLATEDALPLLTGGKLVIARRILSLQI